MTPNTPTQSNPAKTRTPDTSFPAANPDAVKKKILVVDDEPQIRESLRKVLCAEGYEVVLAAKGQKGIEQSFADRFDLLLLDLGLPDISGWEVFGILTTLNPFVPIIIITGRDKQHDMAVLGGAGALIEKPLDVPRLLETVAALLTESPEMNLQRLTGLRNDMRYEGRRAGGSITNFSHCKSKTPKSLL
jgi:DNA-binding response OmpR family regulator